MHPLQCHSGLSPPPAHSTARLARPFPGVAYLPAPCLPHTPGGAFGRLLLLPARRAQRAPTIGRPYYCDPNPNPNDGPPLSHCAPPYGRALRADPAIHAFAMEVIDATEDFMFAVARTATELHIAVSIWMPGVGAGTAFGYAETYQCGTACYNETSRSKFWWVTGK